MTEELGCTWDRYDCPRPRHARKLCRSHYVVVRRQERMQTDPEYREKVLATQRASKKRARDRVRSAGPGVE